MIRQVTELLPGTPVIVKPESKSGKPLPEFNSTITDVRTGVKCLGSVEYLVEGHNRWIPAAWVSRTDECPF